MMFITREEDIKLSKIQVFYFYSSWMPFQQKNMLMLESSEQIYKDIAFFGIDVGEFKNQCKRFGIETVPTTIILKEGAEIGRINGLVNTKIFAGTFADIYLLNT